MFKNPKPHPEPILITLEQMNYDKEIHDVLMIGRYLNLI